MAGKVETQVDIGREEGESIPLYPAHNDGQEDAARYRWLCSSRRNDCDYQSLEDKAWYELQNGTDKWKLDVCIDAAMGAPLAARQQPVAASPFPDPFDYSLGISRAAPKVATFNPLKIPDAAITNVASAGGEAGNFCEHWKLIGQFCYDCNQEFTRSATDEGKGGR